MKSTLRSWLGRGDYTLALSSSYFGFFAHCGIAHALYKEGLKPARISGSSAGALVGGALASGIPPEEMAEILFSLKRSDFWDPYPGLGFLRGEKMLSLFKRYFVSDFKAAKIPLSVAVFDLFSCQTRFLCEGPLPEAVAASCAVPLLFHPVRLGGRLFIDGGVFHKSGITSDSRTGEKLLCAYLQGQGLQGAYEWKAGIQKLKRNQKILRLKKLPSINYNRLNEGRTAYSQAFERTLLGLDLPFSGPIIDDGS